MLSLSKSLQNAHTHIESVARDEHTNRQTQMHDTLIKQNHAFPQRIPPKCTPTHLETVARDEVHSETGRDATGATAALLGVGARHETLVQTVARGKIDTTREQTK
jgi:hypothetical protein